MTLRTQNASSWLGLLVLGCLQNPETPQPYQASVSSASPAGTFREGPEASAEPGDEPKPSAAPSLAERYKSRPALEVFSGKASYYADSLAGNRTASGERYDPGVHSAAHRKLPFGTIVRVIREDTGAVTYVRVNDRGPFAGRNRVIDLSRAAATDLAMLRAGVVPVRVEVLARP